MLYRERPGHGTERWRGAWEPLGDAKRGGDRVRAHAAYEGRTLTCWGRKSKREARVHVAGERDIRGAQEKPGEQRERWKEGGQRGAGECQGEGAGAVAPRGGA